MKKRQEIGRGLRLPVDETGVRVTNESINRLTVIANESYKTFAAALQSEIQEETGVSFTGKIQNARERQEAHLVPGWRNNTEFLALWERIKHRTRYSVAYDTDDLVAKAAEAVRKMPPLKEPTIQTTTYLVGMDGAGVGGTLLAVHDDRPGYGARPIPDLIGYLQRETELTRGTLARILIASSRLPDAAKNPQQFLYHATRAVKKTLKDLMIDGIKYERIDGEDWDMVLFESQEIAGYVTRMLAVKNSLYDAIEVDSETERKFAEAMSRREDVMFFLKLPRWFKVETPIGTYNPDWAIVKQDAGEDARLYLVRETKSTSNVYELRGTEWGKIQCGAAHFQVLPDVNFGRATAADQV